MPTSVHPELKKIEKEIKEIKLHLLKSQGIKKSVKLKGLLEGVKVSEEEIEEVKHTLFSND